MRTLAALEARLGELHQRTRETPLFNPVFQLSLDLSRALEGGEISLDDVDALVAELECDGLKARANRLRRLLAPPAAPATGPDEAEDFASFAARWQNPQLHAVFTAHPTFLLSPAQSAAVAIAASAPQDVDDTVCAVPATRTAVTLEHEHRAAMDAMARAQDARDVIVARALGEARAKWPGEWRSLRPMPFRFASWVGYDMDGRTDIGWHTSIAFRLQEKAERLARYTASLESLDAAHPLLETLRPASAFAAARAVDFAGNLASAEALAAAANRLTTHSPDNLLSLAPLIAALEDEAAAAPDARAAALLTLAASMRADGLGMGWIHFRVNAKQLHNAVRRRLGGDDEGIDLASKGALATLRRMVDEAAPLRTNFAALATESSTAIRQFLAMAQILKHIDADAPIRMLVAECEQPATVLAALYFAKLFGVEGKVDVSPLFETETALEHGGRFLDALLAEPAYRAYARARGRVAVQTGFSDAGRFVGQVPAALAIERLQGRLAEAMAANGLSDIAALVFNTHGESMGRGAHPASLQDRIEWPLSPWARRRFARAGIRLEPEVSFQGGDGYLFFATPELALATLSRIAELRPAEADLAAPADPFYHRTDLSLDFYRAVKDHQGDHLASRTYARAVTAFGLGLLNPTGSRVSRRQSDINADREMSLRQIRAIPHNAILQQLGYPVNVIAGIGSAADGNREEIAALLADSPRGRQIMRLVRAANALASIKTVAAYGELFNSAYWASRTYRGTEDHLAASCAALAEYLVGDDRTGVFRRLASRLRIDALKFHRLTDLLPDDTADTEAREHVRRRIGVLQALRLALLQHMFLKVVAVPAFSRANDISRRDVIDMVLTLRIDDALAQLRRAFPVRVPGPRDFPLDEPSDYPDGGEEGYGAYERDFMTPIARAQELSLRISTAVANEFGAHG
ncbi:phosphoenolpyruvate carboxylase [Porphyrobacter sp. AAP82]|uniref:phosphoenolpyruvate carboxylase n=1 Tax=Porphyrobacter sp. AAP82 TaxID=1248917 RepID=UPI0003081A18|nr:phosphoenolpyruvate carboxylase [Porphyrobacter sp. AAP82]